VQVSRSKAEAVAAQLSDSKKRVLKLRQKKEELKQKLAESKNSENYYNFY